VKQPNDRPLVPQPSTADSLAATATCFTGLAYNFFTNDELRKVTIERIMDGKQVLACLMP